MQVQGFVLKPVNIETLLEHFAKVLKDKIPKIVTLCNNYKLDLESHLLLNGHEQSKLSKRETEFLYLLHKSRANVLKYASIEATLWEDSSMSEAALKTFIRDLRKKLPKEMLKNISQQGYKLICE